MAKRQTKAARSRDRVKMNRFISGSSAGTFPFKRTGQLRRNVQQEYDAATKTARVGTNVVYGKWLEFGTRRMRAYSEAASSSSGAAASETSRAACQRTGSSNSRSTDIRLISLAIE